MAQSIALIQKVIDEKYEVLREKYQKRKILVQPKGFDLFVKSELFTNLILTIFDYCKQLSKIEDKLEQLQLQGLEPKILPAETDLINQQLNRVSEIYAIILLKKGSYNFMYRDQNFFETLIYFVGLVMRKLFDGKSDFKFMEEEINRIFRTNTFNLIKRQHEDKERERKYPILRDAAPGRLTVEQLIDKVQKLSRIPRANRTNEKSEVKPFFIKQSPCASINSRSPLIAMWLPSSKERLFQQERERRARSAQYQFAQKQSKRKVTENRFDVWINDLERQKSGSMHSNQSQCLS